MKFSTDILQKSSRTKDSFVKISSGTDVISFGLQRTSTCNFPVFRKI